MMAFVREVIFSSMRVTSMFRSSAQSTKTGVAPV
jgi:hypothetical protein